MPGLLTAPQVAVNAATSVRTVHRAAEAGDLKHEMKLPGPNGAYLFDPSEAERWARSRLAKTAAA